MAPERTSCAPAIRAATHRALAARERLWAEYPEWEDWRGQVHAAKAKVVAHRQEYRARLQQEVEAWGGVVRFARDAAEARAIILEVAGKHRVRRVVQSKSMTTHEIGLAPFLARHGIGLTETDLGEYIIQLAGHAPAHLTAPALHLNRYQISRILTEPLHPQAPTDPRELTRLAASRLAPRYGEAQMGITGVNFAAVAEGALVCLENEGNLRLVASQPPVHLALMGWEKMLPGLADLEPCLRLLPASATGQRLTSLVHFFRGLKAVPKGTQVFYLVILDNGRSRLAEHPDLKEALYCLRCGACLNICPVFQAGAAHLYGRVYPGAIGILLAPFLPPEGDISDLCTQCGSCRDICPAGISLPQKIRDLRSQAPRFRRARALSWAAGLILQHPRLYRRLEYPARLGARGVFRDRVAELLGGEWPPESFGGQPQSRPAVAAVGSQTLFSPGAPPPIAPGRNLRPSGPPATGPFPGGSDPVSQGSLEEAHASLLSFSGPRDLARYLAESARGEIWLEDHPDLMAVVRELAALGAGAHLVGGRWAPEADTAVTLGLGAVPELGSVLTPGGFGQAAWLPFRARRHVVLAPTAKAGLRVREALALSAQHSSGLVTWLTGPTRTADIEKVLVLGAQGPEELVMARYQGHP